MLFIKETAFFSEANKRPYNQDACFLLSCDGGPELEGKMAVLGVLDGVSNANGGEASRIAARAMRPILAGLLAISDELAEYDTETRAAEILRILREAILTADRCLRRRQFSGVEYGTTITLAAVCDEAVYTANIGDSPAYLLRVDNLSGEIRDIQSLYRCHNEAGEGVGAGRANALTQMVGGAGVSEQKIHTSSTWLGGSDILMLGSDGALAVLPAEKLTGIMDNYIRTGLKPALDALYGAIQATASTDNATVLAVWLEVT